MMVGQWLRRSKDGTAIVFIHGILSDGESCWQNKNGEYWPKLLEAEKQFEESGIYIFTYKTGLFSGTYRLGDVIDSLKEYFRLDALLDNSQIAFVCHSMGGIVARKFIVERKSDFENRNVELGLFLIASPSLGSNYANWLSPLARLFGHTQEDALRFAQTNSWLLDLDKEFINFKESGDIRIEGKELIEDNFIVFKGLIRRQVVEPFSGARYFGEPFKVPNSDHSSIAKPESAESIQHRLLLSFLNGFFKRVEVIENTIGGESAEVDGSSGSGSNAAIEACIDDFSVEDFPVGPIVKQYSAFNLARSYADCFDHFEARALIGKINEARRQASRDKVDVGQIRKGKLPDAGIVGLENFWLEVFEQAALHGPRMMASILLSVDHPQLSDAAKMERSELLRRLQRIASNGSV
ncbi:esterase/lipase family protein [Thalassococcus sp. BH17M4-6]|uniref:esterase/lipase family protein n=1 Tax=Thalassococcus sp. BH17M4-6 TaxID=3413148 RepID=UPI003BDAA1A8